VQSNQQSRSSFTIVSGLEMALEIPLAWLSRTALGRERRYQRRQLLKLDDWLLGDIGYRLNMSDSKSGGAKPATSVIEAKETTMNMRTVTLIAALCTTAAWAPARAQTVETSVVKLSAGHRLQGTSRSAATRHLVRRFLAARPLRRSHQISARHEGHAPLAP